MTVNIYIIDIDINMNTLECLPYEIIIKICDNLSHIEIVRLSQTNHKYYNLLYDWKLWSTLSEKKLGFKDKNFNVSLIKPVERYFYIKKLLDEPIKNFRNSIIKGDADALAILLYYVDCSMDDNFAIRFSSRNGYSKIVEMLLKIPSVDPCANNNEAIIFASKNGHIQTVDLLLKDKRSDPSAINNKSLIDACFNGRVDVVKRLLLDNRVNPSDRGNLAIKYALQQGHKIIVSLLLKHDRFINDEDVYYCSNNNINLDILMMTNEHETYDVYDYSNDNIKRFFYKIIGY